ncbi:hypothetical protein OC861_005995 [Tilletia horrida]|nr:hypothetical protein OC861_005995 [Tilletia horrida]
MAGNALAATAGASRNAYGTHTLFFYGTLVHPAILERVIGNPGAHLRVRTAILPAYATWHVTNVDYPALVSLSNRQPIVPQGQDAATAAKTTVVPGTVVSGLTDSDLRYLDLFEGDEYVRSLVEVLLDDSEGTSNAARPRDASLADILAGLTPARSAELLQRAAAEEQSNSLLRVKAEAYVWSAPLAMLEDKRWIFADFARQKANRWVGSTADHEYTDVDRERTNPNDVPPA